MANTSDYTYKISREKDGEVKVDVEVTFERYQSSANKAFDRLASDVKVAGFRPGKAPEAAIRAKLGDKLLSETIKVLLPEIASEIVDKETLNPVTALDYSLDGIQEDGVKFSFTFTNYPEVKLGDFKKIKLSKAVAEVKDDEIESVVSRLFKQHETDHDHEIAIDDHGVQHLGMEGINTVSELKEQIKKRLLISKEHDLEKEFEQKVLTEAVKVSTIPVPAALLEQQSQSMMEDYLNQIASLKVDVDEFLAAQGLDKEKLAERKREEAKERIQSELLLNQVAKEYSLFPNSEDLEAEIASITDPDVRDHFDSYQGRRHLLSLLIQQRGMSKLTELVTGESQKASESTEKKPAKKEKKAKQ